MSGETGWRKSSLSDNSGGNCIEVRRTLSAFEVRDTDDPTVVVTVRDASFAAFLEGVKAGEFDSL